MAVFDKVKQDALAAWDAIEGKLSHIKSPILRLGILAFGALALVWLLMSVLPQLFVIIIGIGLVLLVFKLFHDSVEDDDDNGGGAGNP